VILVTGATGFIGRVLLPRLAEAGHSLRCLVRASPRSPRLPPRVPVQLAIGALDDPRVLRSALMGVDTVIHLAGAEWQGRHGDLLAVDVNGTRALVEAAAEAQISRFVYVSHLGADRASAYPVLKAKGIAEEFVRQSGVTHLILRSAFVYGREDVLINTLAALIRLSPGVLFLPGDGRTTVQPLWVEDLATCLEWALSDPALWNQTLALGGPEFFTLRELSELVMEKTNAPRRILNASPVWLRWGAWFTDQIMPRSPLTPYWLDHFAQNRVCELTGVTRYFGLKPARLEPTLDYLRERKWWGEVWRRSTQR
jgi:NADH dehydrogenase